MTRRKTRRKASTTRRRRTASTVTRRRRRRRNPLSAAPARRRRSTRRRNPISVRRVRRRSTRRRNPALFGRSMSTTQMGQAIIGGLVGVTATKMITAQLPANIVSGPFMRVVASGFAAFVAGWLAGRVSQPFGDAVTFGGLMQTGSLALNAIVPTIGSQIGLRGGLGELVAGHFVVPQNPLSPYAMPMMAAGPSGTYGENAPVTMSGRLRSFGRAF